MNTGNYALHAQRTNNPIGAANLPFAQVQTGIIGSAAQSNTFKFSANANDIVDFTLAVTSGNLVPNTVLRRGSTATGVVTQAAASKTMGRAGKLSFTINDVKLRNGAGVPVRAFNRTSGENRTGEMVAMMLEMPIVSAPFSCSSMAPTLPFPAERRSLPS